MPEKKVQGQKSAVNATSLLALDIKRRFKPRGSKLNGNQARVSFSPCK